MPLSRLDHLTNAWSSIIAIGCSILYFGNMTNYLSYTPLTCVAVPYFALDIMKCNMSNKIHHLCTLSLIYSTRMEPFPAVSFFLYKMETTTVLYNMLPYVPKGVKTPLSLAFVAGYTKVRVFDYYFFLESIRSANWETQVPLYVLYTINLYWYTLILSKLWNRFKSRT